MPAEYHDAVAHVVCQYSREGVLEVGEHYLEYATCNALPHALHVLLLWLLV